MICISRNPGNVTQADFCKVQHQGSSRCTAPPPPVSPVFSDSSYLISSHSQPLAFQCLAPQDLGMCCLSLSIPALPPTFLTTTCALTCVFCFKFPRGNSIQCHVSSGVLVPKSKVRKTSENHSSLDIHSSSRQLRASSGRKVL